MNFRQNNLLIMLSPMMLAIMVASLDMAVMPTILPVMVDSLGDSQNSAWVMTAYMFAATVTAPVYGCLSDTISIQRLLQFALLVFALGATLCASAGSINFLILARFIEGIGSGGLMVLGFILVGKTVTEKQQGICQGILGGVTAFAALSGPLLGGIISEYLGWQLIFLLYIPLSLGAVVLSHYYLPKIKYQNVAKTGFDYCGFILLTLLVADLLYAINQLSAGVTLFDGKNLISIISLIMLFIVFIIQELRAKSPLIPVRLFSNKTLVSILVVVFLSALSSAAATFFLPQYFQYVIGVSSGMSGILIEPVQIGMIIGPVIAGWLTVRHMSYQQGIIISIMLLIVAYLSISLPENALTVHLIALPSLTLLGLGLGAIMPLLTLSVQRSVEPTLIGTATSLLGLFRSLGSLFGLTLFKLIYSSSLLNELHQINLGKVSIKNALANGIAAFGENVHLQYMTFFDNAFSQVFYFAAGLAVISLLFVYKFDMKQSMLVGINKKTKFRRN